MSFIIDQQTAQCFNRFRKKIRERQQKTVKPIKRQYTFQNILVKYLQKYIDDNSLVTTRINLNGCTYIALPEMSFNKKLYGSFTFKIASNLQKSVAQLDLLTVDNNLYLLKNKHKRILVNKQLIVYSSYGQNMLFTPKLDMVNGRISFFVALRKIIPQDTYLEAMNIHGFFENVFNFLVKQVQRLAEFICKITQNDPLNSRENEHQISRINLLYKYNHLLLMKKELFDKSQQIPQKILQQTKKQQSASLCGIVSSRVPIDIQKLKTISLYTFSFQRPYHFDQHKSAISQEEGNYFANIINLNCNDKSRNNLVNIVQATIFIKQPENIQYQPFRSSSNLVVAETKFWYICSGALGTDGNPQHYDQRNMIKKNMLIKKQNFPQKGVASKKSNKHQKSIILQMKNSHSLLINRYYQPSNQPNIFNGDILMQFIPFPTLTQYSILNKNSISIITKLHFIYFIIQSLRSLNSYKITHMDLKPNNILTHFFNYIRLVDFGQSYHPLVCDQGYKPGFTVPYCAPEIMRGKKQFTIKYDVFALGVIISEVLFQKYPFYFYKDSNLHKYKTCQYLDHWLGCPQEVENYGNSKLINVFWNIIGRCLEQEPENRPEINILAIILQLCLQILY